MRCTTTRRKRREGERTRWDQRNEYPKYSRDILGVMPDRMRYATSDCTHNRR